MGARSRRKGAEYEREIVHAIREALHLDDQRCFRGAMLQAGNAKLAPDVVTPLLPFWWECAKNGSPKAKLRQAIEAAPKDNGTIPVAVTREDRGESLVTLRLEDFLSLVKEWDAGRRR